MELIIFLLIVAVGLFWYYNTKSKAPVSTVEFAPYKVETPPAAPTVTEVAAAAEVSVKPVKAKKAAAPKAKKPAAMKAKEKAPAKKPRAQKTSA